MKKFIKGSTDVVDMSFESLVKDYCDVSVVNSVASEIMASYKPKLIEEFQNRGITKFSEDGRFLEMREVNRRNIDAEALIKVCKKKDIEIGKIFYTIRPKKSNIPEDVLKMLDEYFILESNVEATYKDVQKALDAGLITKNDYSKIVQENISYSLYPKVDDTVVKEIIE